MLGTIPYHLIALTAFALIVALGIIKFFPETGGIWLKRLEYYRKRRVINRLFKKDENDIVYSTFLLSFCDLDRAVSQGSKRHAAVVRSRHNRLVSLMAEYQPYFKRELQYQQPY